MAVCQNLVPLVNIKIVGKWMFIPLKMVCIGIDPSPDHLLVPALLDHLQNARTLVVGTSPVPDGRAPPLTGGELHKRFGEKTYTDIYKCMTTYIYILFIINNYVCLIVCACNSTALIYHVGFKKKHIKERCLTSGLSGRQQPVYLFYLFRSVTDDVNRNVNIFWPFNPWRVHGWGNKVKPSWDGSRFF